MAKTTKKSTIRDILDASEAAQLELYKQELQLKARSENIKDAGYDGPLTKAQIDELKAITAARGALGEAQKEIAVMTVASLNQSAEVQRLVNVVTALNEDLADKLKQINDIAKKIKGIGDLLKGMAKVLTNLTALAALL